MLFRSLGRAARATSSVRTRQPLGRALISAPGWSTLPDDLREQVAEELNVLELEGLGASDGDAADLVDVAVKANFRSLGARYAKQTPAIAAFAIAPIMTMFTRDPVAIATSMASTTPTA